MDSIFYFDIDGLLARFTDGACKMFGKPVKQPTKWGFHHDWGLTDRDLYANMGYGFWANLDVWEDGFELLRLVETVVGIDRIVLITTPCETPGCYDGKRAWVLKHLPHYLPSLIVGGAKHKLAAPSKILLDDSDKNVEAFYHAGGFPWTIPRPWNRRYYKCDENGMFNPTLVFSELEAVL